MEPKPMPKEFGYTMPGEFEKHAGCWMGWPYDGNLWRNSAKLVQAQYAAIAKAISEFEPLTMFAYLGEVRVPFLQTSLTLPYKPLSIPLTNSQAKKLTKQTTKED